MPTITTPDGVELYYTEHGTGQPVVFSHGWPLNGDAWALELKVFADAASARSPTTVVATGVPARPPRATTSTPTPATSPP